jgi:hypothetical protein
VLWIELMTSSVELDVEVAMTFSSYKAGNLVPIDKFLSPHSCAVAVVCCCPRSYNVSSADRGRHLSHHFGSQPCR